MTPDFLKIKPLNLQINNVFICRPDFQICIGGRQ